MTMQTPDRSMLAGSLVATGCRVALAMLVALAVGLAGCSKEQQPKKQAAVVKLLPPTPPPPPPPKPEEKKPEPEKREDKPQQQLNPPKTEAPPQPQALKSDEAPGEGAGSGIQAGAVTTDYSNQAIGTGNGGANKMQFALFKGRLERHLQSELARTKDLRSRDYRLELRIWLNPSGSFGRVELLNSTGDESQDDLIKRAMSQVAPLDQVPPDLPQPLTMRFVVRGAG